jgi:hypothetical protein
MKNIIYIAIVLICSCTSFKPANCDQSSAQVVANLALEKAGFQLAYLKNSISETDTSYNFNYSAILENTRGNEAKLIISKKSCKVIEKKFYQ